MEAIRFIPWHLSWTFLLAFCTVLTSYIFETTTYKALAWLEKHGVIERLAPQFRNTEEYYKPKVASTFLISSWLVLSVALSPPVLSRLLEFARPSWDPFQIATTCCIGLVLHDAWFFLAHTLLHACKPLYRRVHITHHMAEGDLTVFDTADMEASEAIVLFFGFYAVLLLYYTYVVGFWNPVAYVVFVLLEANLNMTGHHGYRQPQWLAALQTWGVCFVPGVAEAKTHYIHHLDPRYNKALYFTWWDRASGTFSEQHPQIKELSVQEQKEYEVRAYRKLLCTWKRGLQWLHGHSVKVK